MIKRILVVGGANGVGLSIAKTLSIRETTEKVYVIDKLPFLDEYKDGKIEAYQFDLVQEDYSFFDRFSDINAMMITAGFGKLSLFKDVPETYISNSFNVNTIPVMKLIHRFYSKLESEADFYCGVMVSIAGFMSSPFYAVYGATKAALKIFIESINIELKKAGSHNTILNVSPGSIKGTSFLNEKTDLSMVEPMAQQIIRELENKNDLYIPQYEDVYKYVLERYHEDFRKEGEHSYDYKVQSGRIK